MENLNKDSDSQQPFSFEQQTTHHEQQAHIGRTFYLKPQEKNNLGLAGFILSILAILLSWVPVIGQIIWLLGLIFSLIGIFKQPKGFAIAGLVISLFLLVLLIILVGIIGIAFLSTGPYI